MPTIEESLVSFLKADVMLTGLIGGRIYPEEAPQNAGWPHITYQIISYPQKFHLAGPSGLASPRIQIDCWAKGSTGKKDVVAIAEAVRNAKGPGVQKLDGFTGLMYGVRVQRVNLEDRRYSSEPPVHANEDPFRRASLDFTFWFDE